MRFLTQRNWQLRIKNPGWLILCCLLFKKFLFCFVFCIDRGLAVGTCKKSGVNAQPQLFLAGIYISFHSCFSKQIHCTKQAMCSHTYGIGSPVKHLNDLVHRGRFALACVSHRAGGLSSCLSLGMCVWGGYQTPWGYLHNIFSSAAGLTVPVAGAYWYTLVCLLTSHHTHTPLFKISHKVQETIDGICIAVHSQGAI